MFKKFRMTLYVPDTDIVSEVYETYVYPHEWLPKAIKEIVQEDPKVLVVGIAATAIIGGLIGAVTLIAMHAENSGLIQSIAQQKSVAMYLKDNPGHSFEWNDPPS